VAKASSLTSVIEKAGVRFIEKPWGATTLRPWYLALTPSAVIGEICYERQDQAAPTSTLLLKLLFTATPLSIQVHPNDAYALAHGQPNGKTEAWYVLHAEPSAKIALGLSRVLTRLQFRNAIADGSISDLISWISVKAGDVISIPAGTIHGAGAGLVLAEIQQRSDTTFRILDQLHKRDLHIEDAVAVAMPGPAPRSIPPRSLSGERVLLEESEHFILEKISLPANTDWTLRAIHETWLLIIDGRLWNCDKEFTAGDALYLEDVISSLRVDSAGATCLLAYNDQSVIADLLQKSP
jgi:mannose-6-phosphate isomerase